LIADCRARVEMTADGSTMLIASAIGSSSGLGQARPDVISIRSRRFIYVVSLSQLTMI
jgi:hypothetical protein